MLLVHKRPATTAGGFYDRPAKTVNTLGKNRRVACIGYKRTRETRRYAAFQQLLRGGYGVDLAAIEALSASTSERELRRLCGLLKTR